MAAEDQPRARKISAIIACYKDAQAIPIMAERLTQTFRKIEVDYEIIFVNDGSPDDTQAVLERLTAADRHIKGITHSRNFGSQNAFTSGMKLATGDACVLLDGDLQDPPELIADFYAKWCEGFDVVYGIRVKREMPTLTEFGYKAFYRLFQHLAYVRVPLDAGDFSLIDRSVMNVLNALPERDRFLRGLRAWAGFKQTGVPYVRPERMFGRSTNNLWSNLRWARKGIFSFSYVPLELISVGALVVSFLSLLAGVAQIVAKIFWPHVPQGIPTIIVLCLFLGSIQLFSIAFLAEYIGKIFEEVKQRPQFVVTKTLNFDASQAGAPASAAPEVRSALVADRREVAGREPHRDLPEPAALQASEGHGLRASRQG
jgi:dolichol-phosphate mannosyltransferase